MSWPSDPNGSWRLWFLRPRPEARTHHLYLIQYDDPHLRELTAFRDRLRTDASACQQYADLKQALAQKYPTDRDAYTAAKTSFVVKLLRQAGIEPEPARIAPGLPLVAETDDAAVLGGAEEPDDRDRI